MKQLRFAIGILIILLSAETAGVSTYTPEAGSAHSTAAQDLALVIPGWQQVNSSGFGDPTTGEVTALEAFNGYLYAGTQNPVAPGPLPIFDGAQIFRSSDGVTWASVSTPGFGNPHDTAAPAILDLTVFGGKIYASTGWGGNEGQIWRASTGVSWAPMVAAGFGDPEIHDIAALAAYNSYLYAGASSQVSGALIYRSFSGDSNTWNPVDSVPTTLAGASVTGFAVYNSALWAAVESEDPVQIWRSDAAGNNWTAVMSDGFSASPATSTGGMAVFGGNLYVGAGNTADGAQLWRTNNGTTWDAAITPGFGDPNNQKVETVFVFQNQLYISVKNAQTGIKLWRSPDGTLWERANLDGFGDSNNTHSNHSSASADFLGHLYVGTANIVDGGELWRMQQKYIFLPFVLRQP